MQPLATEAIVRAGDLKRIREALGLTQEELADELGVHRVTVARWEVGTRKIPELAARLVERIRVDAQRRRRMR
jgi:DNA-binding transcriptional regulator YiaG